MASMGRAIMLASMFLATGLTRDGAVLDGFDPIEDFEAWEVIRFASRLRDSDLKDPGDESLTTDLLQDAEEDASEDGEDLSDDEEMDEEDDESEDEFDDG